MGVFIKAESYSFWGQLDAAFAGLPKQLETWNHCRDDLHGLPIDICQNHNLRNCRKKVCLNWSTSASEGLSSVASKSFRRPQSEALFFHNRYKAQLLEYDCWAWRLSLLKFWGAGVVVRPVSGQKEFDVRLGRKSVEALLLPFLSRTTESYHFAHALSRPIKQYCVPRVYRYLSRFLSRSH